MAMPRKLACTVKAIADHGNRVYTVDLEPQGVVPRFRPGQFLHLTVEDYDPSGFWPESRVFSIVSSPEERNRLRICYSVVGKYTTRMESLLKVGGTAWVKLPYGEFEIDSSQDAVLLAGGTGIGAFMAFLGLLSPAQVRDVHLFYGARHPDLLLYRSDIEGRLSLSRKLQVAYFTEAGGRGASSEANTPEERKRWFDGRLDLEVIWPLLPEPGSRVFYLSGPPAMINALKAGLIARGVPSGQVCTDAWE